VSIKTSLKYFKSLIKNINNTRLKSVHQLFDHSLKICGPVLVKQVKFICDLKMCTNFNTLMNKYRAENWIPFY